MTNVQVERGYLTQSLGSASHSGDHGLRTVPGLLRLVLEKEAWKERIIVQTGEEFPGFRNFEDYLRGNPPKGLGIGPETIDKLIGKDEDLRAKFYAALRRPHGGDRKSEEAKDGIKVDNVNLDTVKYEKPTGNTKAYALQKLSDEGQTELLDQVKAGTLSPSAAMKKAGFRKPRIEISLTNPAAAAKSIVTHATPEFLEELRKLL